GAFGAGSPSFFARRASRNFLILALGRSLCFAQTIPKTGAAGFLQPGTGHNWRGGFLRAFLPTVAAAARAFGGRPGPRRGATPNADRTDARARSMTWLSMSAES